MGDQAMNNRYMRVILALLLLTIGPALSYASTTDTSVALPLTQIHLDATPIVGVNNWRIIGAFPLPENAQVYTAESEEDSFAHDYLAEIHGSEVPLKFPPTLPT